MTPTTSSVATSSTSSTRPTGPTTVRAAHRVRLCYRDEAYRQRTEHQRAVDVFEFLGIDWCKSSSMETSGHV
ncbi:hypothetical protein JG688_00010459 [Phytophthora aleatoria]|uniref:Uncharacterized protein n=1 Tax=Phytophthora aleatoria TaxID=2496075 RepID=A0A8J5M5X6_9STRA|nr:hypothetical protein JG688_00010459 [Phytophthora aleatoria]